MTPARVIIAIIVLAVLFIFGRNIASAIYFDKRAQLKEDMTSRQEILASFKEERQIKYPPIDNELRDLANRTLGHDRETVEAALRARLNRLAERYELAESSVTSGRYAEIDSPAKRIIDRRNPLRDAPDFAEVEATVSGKTTLENAVRLMDAIENEAWIKRIDSIALDPAGDTARFDMNVRLTTLYIPGRRPDPDRAFPSYTGEQYARVAAFVSANHFAKPAAPVVAQNDPPPSDPGPAPPPPAPQFPYKNWRVTGIVHGSGGWEVWLVNGATNESSTLVVGQQLGDAVLVDAGDELAVFQLNEVRFKIRVGSTLVDRTPVETGEEPST